MLDEIKILLYNSRIDSGGESFMKAKIMRRQKRWMLPLGMLLLACGALCLWMLTLSMQYMLPAKAETTHSVQTTPMMNRDNFVWVPPEPEPEDEPEPVPYQFTINLSDVQSHHNSNADVIGWIRIQDTVINYPIMQTNNNNFYTNHNWLGQPTSHGAIFADWRCDLDTSDNSLIYGHNLANGTMLHAIKNYKVEEWGNTHPYIEVASLTHRYLYKVLSVNVLYGERGAEFDYWNYIDLNRTDYNAFYKNLKRSAIVWYGDSSDPPRDKRDRLIALQTCNSGAHDGMRCIVFAQCIGDFPDASSYLPGDEKKEARIVLE